MRLISTIKQRIRPAAQDGFTMLLAIGAMILLMALSAAAVAAVTDDLPGTTNDTQQKQAYAAAEAGIQQYLFDLDQDNQFWTQCVPAPAQGINNVGSTANQRIVPGSSNEYYAIELMPASGYSQCVPNDGGVTAASMIQPEGTGAGSLRIRATGFACSAGAPITAPLCPDGKSRVVVQRSIVALLRESTFLDYVWFTQYETDDPIEQAMGAGCVPNGVCPNGESWDTVYSAAQAQCAQYWRDGRGNTPFYNDGRDSQYCDQIFFTDGENIQGPMHTDDEYAICGSPIFGRNSSDNIETGAPAPGESTEGDSNCTDGVDNKGTVVNNAPILQPPATDGALESAAQSNGLVLQGNTCIQLTTSQNTVDVAKLPLDGKTTCQSPGLSWSPESVPNGVVYVADDPSEPCTVTYNYTAPDYTAGTAGSPNSGCGTVYVSGTYGSPLTIGAENDIVVDGSIYHSGSDALLGLVANGFVRVEHTCSSGMGPLNIDAAILSVQHGFIVDDYDCGGFQGQLTVFGSIAQKFRGPVGTFGSDGGETGYDKNYVYDDRLRYEEPPDFLDPQLAAWHVIRQNECTPITSGPVADQNPC